MPGPRNPYLTPYAVPFGQAIARRRHRRVVLVMFAQGGKSETLLDVIGQRLDQEPAPILYVGPSKQFLQEQFEPRIMALLDEAPTLADKVARGKRMTKTRKVIAGVPLRLAHAGSSTALKSDPAALGLTDEADELMANVKGQGDPIGLIDARGDTYADFVHGIVSTPSLGAPDIERDPESGLEFWRKVHGDQIDSTIWKLWQEGTRFHWAWPCLHCGEYFIPRFSCLKWPEKATPAEAKAAAVVACPRCGGVHEETDKAELNARGTYVAPGQRIEPDGAVIGDPPESTTISFWVSGLASPFVSFGARAESFVKATESGDREKVQTVINAGFGECYAPGGGDVPEWSEVLQLRRPYRAGSLPSGVILLTLAVDVQKRSLIYGIRGWGAKATSWLVEFGEILAPTGTTADPEVWEALDELLGRTWDGLPIRLAFIDSGFRPTKAEAGPEHVVYEFCRTHQRQTHPTKGYDTLNSPLVLKALEVTPGGDKAPYSLELVRLNTDWWKLWVHERIRWPAEQPGGFYIPGLPGGDTSDEALFDRRLETYARQLVSEARLKKPSGRATWVRRSRDNHFLDIEAMNAAAGYLLNAHRIPEGMERQGAGEKKKSSIADIARRLNG